MTYWATLWYAGTVVLTMGYEGQTLEQCIQLGELMMSDIEKNYTNPVTADTLANTMFPVNRFDFSCETVRLPTNTKY